MNRADETPAPASGIRKVLRQVGVSALIWAVFGVVVGICLLPNTRPSMVLASVIAGVIVLAPFGALMGLCGGKWLEVVAGGVLGFAVGLVTAVVRGEPCGFLAALGIIMGGQVGATAISFFWRLPRLLKRVLLPARSHSHVQQPELA